MGCDILWHRDLRKGIYLLEGGRLDVLREAGHDARRHVDLVQHVHLEVGCERVRQPHVSREGAQNQVPHLHNIALKLNSFQSNELSKQNGQVSTLPTYLDAVGRDDVTEGVVVVAEELGEVVQQDEQHAQRPLVQQLRRLRQLSVAYERRQELEQVDEQLRVHAPALQAQQQACQQTRVLTTPKPSLQQLSATKFVQKRCFVSDRKLTKSVLQVTTKTSGKNEFSLNHKDVHNSCARTTRTTNPMAASVNMHRSLH